MKERLFARPSMIKQAPKKKAPARRKYKNMLKKKTFKSQAEHMKYVRSFKK